MKEDKYTRSLAKNRVYAIVHMRDIRENVLPKFCAPFRGTNMAAGNQQKHLSLSFPTYA